jgi:hypothetical protein
MKLSDITVPMLLWGLAALLNLFMAWKQFCRWALVTHVHLLRKGNWRYSKKTEETVVMYSWAYFFWFAFHATAAGVSLHFLLRSLP